MFSREVSILNSDWGTSDTVPLASEMIAGRANVGDSPWTPTPHAGFVLIHPSSVVERRATSSYNMSEKTNHHSTRITKDCS